MSRVHDALRRAAQTGNPPPSAPADIAAPPPDRAAPPAPDRAEVPATPSPMTETLAARSRYSTALAEGFPSLQDLLSRIEEVPFNPLPDSLLIESTRHDAPTEEFRSLRTRLNHLQSLQPIHSVVVTSASPAEGKSFTAANLAIAQAQLAGNRTLLCDFDFRRPILHSFFQLDRTPGITDFLIGKAELHETIKKLAGTNLYIMPAGEAVINPLELLNLREVKMLVDQLPSIFNWVVLDTPPLLFAADANLISTLTHGTILVVRMGTTTIDSVTRAMQSLCQNNVLGIVVNGARRGELYSKYSYYHSYYQPRDEQSDDEEAAAATSEG